MRILGEGDAEEQEDDAVGSKEGDDDIEQSEGEDAEERKLR